MINFRKNDQVDIVPEAYIWGANLRKNAFGMGIQGLLGLIAKKFNRHKMGIQKHDNFMIMLPTFGSMSF